MITNNKSQREIRKLEHIHWALRLPEGPRTTGFEDVHFIHQALPELNYNEIDLSCQWLGKSIKAPLLINAITGGAEETSQINAILSKTAKRFGLAMAVGSQSAALENRDLRKTYSIARKINPHGILLANVSANVPWKEALQAIEMIEADGLQLHLNVLQELLMDEGDRDFRGIWDNIGYIIENSPVPVIVKEVGFGLSKEAAQKLYQAGARILDLGGSGGTNFAAIENSRKNQEARQTFVDWGIPTACSLLEVASLGLPIQIVASGGIRTGIEICKALRLGAQIVGIAGSFLKTLIENGEQTFIQLVETLLSEIKITLLLTGAENLDSLKAVPVVITGNTLEWIRQRNLKVWNG